MKKSMGRENKQRDKAMVTWKVCSSREKSVRHVQNTFWYISSRPYKTMDRNNQMNSSDHRGNLFSSHFDVSKVHLFLHVEVANARTGCKDFP